MAAKKPKSVAPKPSEATTESSKDSPKIITWKDLVVTFIIFFLIFGVVGYIRGRTVKFSTERMYVDVIKYDYLQMTENSQGKRKIVYQCENKPIIAWDIDNNKIQPLEANTKLLDKYEYSPAVFKNELLVTAFLSGGGGVMSVFTAREALSLGSSGSGNKLLNSGYIKLIVVAVLATISGYEVGYQIALSEESCNDPRYYKYLNDEVPWKEDKDGMTPFEKLFYLTKKDQIEEKVRATFPECKSSDTQIKSTQEENINNAKIEYITLKEGELANKGSDLKSADYDALKKIEDVLDEFNKNCGG